MKRQVYAGLLSVCFQVGCAHGSAPSQSSLPCSTVQPGIAVNGIGKVTAVPDMASFSLGVETRRPSAEKARDASARVLTNVLTSLAASGVARSDIQSTDLSIVPEYDYTDAGRKLLGYVATNTVRVRVKGLESVGKTIDAAVAVGGNEVRLNDLSFEVSNAEVLQKTARQSAVNDARNKAQQLANATGVTLGEPLVIEELTAASPQPMLAQMRAARSAEHETPIQPGTIEIRIEVRIQWKLSGNSVQAPIP